jgi:hypothetical protein
MPFIEVPCIQNLVVVLVVLLAAKSGSCSASSAQSS